MRFLLVALEIAGLSLLSTLVLPATLRAQAARSPLPEWRAELPAASPPAEGFVRELPAPLEAARPVSKRRNHTGTGLLVGSLVGAAATGLFLYAFCSDDDTACGADEVGRAVLIIGMPFAAAGALIGALVRTNDEDPPPEEPEP
jgi:hypothetical protein